MGSRRHGALLLSTGCLVAIVLIAASAVAMRRGTKNPHGTPISDPVVEVLVESTRHQPALDATGRFLAVESSRTEGRLGVFDPVTGETVDEFEMNPQAVPRQTLTLFGWDRGELWVSIDGYASGDCLSTAVFIAAGRSFHPRTCSELPPGLVERRRSNLPPPSDGLPPAADTPAPSRYGYLNAVTLRSLDGSLYALDVTEREYHALTGEWFPIYDTRLLDHDGRFIAQFDRMSVVGWAHDGSLIVHDDPSADFGSALASEEGYNTSRISPDELDRFVVAAD